MNNYQLEGVDNNFDNSAMTGIILPAEAIGAVDISTSNYDPEFGNAGGSVTTVTMASGTNQYHDSVFAYHQNRSLRTNQPFATEKAAMVYNQFAGAIGGPVVRDRWFFFGDYQPRPFGQLELRYHSDSGVSDRRLGRSAYDDL